MLSDKKEFTRLAMEYLVRTQLMVPYTGQSFKVDKDLRIMGRYEHGKRYLYLQFYSAEVRKVADKIHNDPESAPLLVSSVKSYESLVANWFLETWGYTSGGQAHG